MEIKNLHKYVRIYNEERVLFEDIGPKARKRGFLRFEEFFKICMWKSVRPKKRYIKNKDTIEEMSKKAFSETDEKKKMEILCELEGVRVPTASAILTIVFPDNYAVIDVRCIEMLNELGFKIKNSMSIKIWLEYLELVRKLAKENKVHPRKIDMALFAMHKEKLDKEGYKNLY